MNDPLLNRLREAGWRRPLTAAEEVELRAWFAAHPETQADWAAEIALREGLGRLPDAPVATNFTARVLQALPDESSAARPPLSRWTWSWRSLLPRAAVAVIALSAAVFFYEQHQAARKAEWVRKVAAVSEVAALSDPKVLQDFDTIRHLSEVPQADRDLLALGLK